MEYRALQNIEMFDIFPIDFHSSTLDINLICSNIDERKDLSVYFRSIIPTKQFHKVQFNALVCLSVKDKMVFAIFRLN